MAKKKKRKKPLLRVRGGIAYTRRGRRKLAWEKAKSWNPGDGESEAVRKARALLEAQGRDVDG